MEQIKTKKKKKVLKYQFYTCSFQIYTLVSTSFMKNKYQSKGWLISGNLGANWTGGEVEEGRGAHEEEVWSQRTGDFARQRN